MLTFANPWGLLALASVPAILAVYFFRRRFRPRAVAGLFLWPPAAQEPPSGRKRSRLEAPLSLFLELLAALLLSALVSGARWERTLPVPHRIVVLDSSASMAARSPDGDSAADRAIRAVQDSCRDLGDPEAVLLTVILSGPRPRVLIGPAARAGERWSELQKWTPRLPRHSFGPAMTLASRLADAGGEIVLITDHPAEAAAEVGPGVRIRAVGRPLPNVGITLAERTLDRGGSKVHVRLANFGPGVARRTLKATDESGAVLATAAVEMEANSDTSLTWSVAAGQPVVHLRLEGSDALEWDDAALLLEPRPRTIGVRCELPESSPTRKRIERACRAVAHAIWLGPKDPEEAHLVIRAEAPPSPSAWTLLMAPAPAELRAGGPLDPLLGPYVVDTSHPVMEQLDFRGVIWSGAHPIKADPRVVPLVTAGDVPLLFEWRAGTLPCFVMNIEADRSNAYKSPAWPLLFHNVVRERREHLPGLRRWNFRAGETVSCRTAARDEVVTVVAPGGEELSGARSGDRIDFLDVATPGLYELKSPSGNDRFVVNLLDPYESDLRGAADVAPAPTPTAAGVTLVQTAAWRWLDWILCALALLLVLGDLAWLARSQRERTVHGV